MSENADPLADHPLVERAREFQDYEGPVAPAEPKTVQVGSQPEIKLYGNVDEQTQVPIPAGGGYYDTPQEVPNYEKLSRFERWVYDRLPGFAESSVGQALAKFNESWAGKLLQKIDIPAEGLERTTGLATQYLASIGDPEASEDFRQNLEAAWFAGSLAADEWFHHMPRMQEGRLQWPTDTPGKPVGADQLRIFRDDISSLMKQGMSGEEALAQVRDKYYESLGALAIRSQMGDAVFHILADPLNVVMGFLHPVEKVQKYRQTLGAKVLAQHADEAADAARMAQETLEAAEDAMRVAKGLEPGEAILKNIDEVADAEDAVRVLSEAVEDATVDLNMAKAGNPDNLDEIARLTDEVSKLESDLAKARTDVADLIKAGERLGELDEAVIAEKAMELADARRNAQEMQEFASYAAKHKMNWAEEKLYHIFRADPMYVPPDNLWTRLNPFALTRSSRAHELMNTILDNINTRLFSVQGTGPDEWMRAVQRARAGFYTREFGHSIITTEGRAVKASLDAAAESMEQALRQYQKLENFEGPLLRRIGNLLGEHPSDVLRRLADGEEAALATQIMEKVTSLGDEAADVPLLLRSANLTMDDLPEALNRLRVYNGFEIYTPELFQLEMMNRLVDRTAELAIAKFGIRQQGAVHRYADAIKAAESLAFLKANPAYPIRNAINNFFTSVGRGVYGNPFKSYDDLFKTLGIPEPARFRSGIGWGGMVDDIEVTETIAKAYARGSEAIRDIERPMTGRLGKFTRWVQKHKGLGFGKMAQDIESRASVRAYGAAFSNYMSEGHQMGKTLTRVSEFNPELAEMLGPQRVKLLEQAIESNWSEKLIREAIFEDNAHINISSILEGARQNTGLPINDILGPDFTNQVGKQLAQVARTGGEGAVVREMKRIRTLVQQHIDDHVDNVVNTMLEETAARVSAEGPGSFPSLLSETMDDLMVAQYKHGLEMADIGDILKGTTGKTKSRFWDNLMADNQAFFRRNWQRMEARVAGVQKGITKAIEDLRGAGKLTDDMERTLTRFSDEFTDSFTSWRSNWDEFFEFRNKSYEELRKMRPGKKRDRHWANLTDELDRRYQAALDAEDAFTHRMDKSVSKLLPEEQAEAFMKGRNRIASHRKGLREQVLSFRRQVRHMPKEIRENAWKKMWGEYMQQSKQMAIEERTFMAAMQGDPIAMERMGMVPEEIQRVIEVKDKLLRGLGGHFSDELKETYAKLRSQIVETDELRRLRGRFGEFDPETVHEVIAAELGDWRAIDPDYGMVVARGGYAEKVGEMVEVDPFGKVPLPTMDEILEEYPLESIVDAWVKYNNRWKKTLAEAVKRSPEAARHTQDVAQWVLREMGFDDISLYSGKLDMFISTSGKTLQDVKFRPFDSLTADARVAGRFADFYESPFVFEFEVPIENIFTHHMAHQGFQAHPTEYEFILNDLGYENVILKSINGNAPTPEQIAILREIHPEMNFASQAQEMPFLSSFHDVVKRQLVDGKAIDELWYMRGSQALDAIEESAIGMANTPNFKFDVPEGAENMLRAYMDKVSNETSDNLYRATRMGEWGRDSALLNYNRRYNYNTWLGAIAPYEFWATQTAWKWALHSIDRPAMLSTYLRMKKFMNTAGHPSAGFPSRLRQHIRIPMPFLPDWMGNDVFVDPMSTALPFDNFARPFERMKSQAESDEFKAERVLEELLNDGKINQQQYDQALAGKEGPVWERAIALGRQDDSENRQSGFDFMSMMVSPHAPILWAYNLARGTPENIQPALPLTRSIKGVTALLGVGPNKEGINIEGKIRTMMGLPAFDKWDDYRIDRMLSNMAATQEITVEEALRAMIERQGPIYMTARRRAAKEFGVGAMGSITGIPTKSYPVGEENLRQLKPLYEAAWEAYENGDMDAVQDFYDKYPEYETRLALWDEPEERMQSFLIDQLWSKYHDLSDTNKWELREQLGPTFEQAFLSRDTRNYDAIPLEEMQYWLASMGGEPVGTFSYSGSQAFTPVELTDPATARQIDSFYDIRERMFRYREVIKPLQDQYFSLEEGAPRRDFRRQHPALEQYWDWRREYLKRNSNIVPYIVDDPDKRPKYESVAEMQQAAQIEQQQGGKTRDEWRVLLGYSAWNLVESNITQGMELDPAVLEYIELTTGQDPTLVLGQIGNVLAP